MDRANGRTERQGWSTEVAVLKTFLPTADKVETDLRTSVESIQEAACKYFVSLYVLKCEQDEQVATTRIGELKSAMAMLLRETLCVECDSDDGSDTSSSLVGRLGSVVKGIRMLLRLEQGELARAAGTSASALSQLERQGKAMSIATLADVASAMYLPTWVLFLLADLVIDVPRKGATLFLPVKSFPVADEAMHGSRREIGK
jgi:DNA-binding XRE family transcriptional regulator